jgi:hypothetical protein
MIEWQFLLAWLDPKSVAHQISNIRNSEYNDCSMTHHGHAAHYCSYAQARLPSFLSALLKRHWTQVTLVKVNIINSRLPCADMVCSLKAGLLCPGLPFHSSKSPVCHRRTWNIQRTDWRFLVTWDASCKGRVWQQPLEHSFKHVLQ